MTRRVLGEGPEGELVFDGERVDELQIKGLRLIQSPAAFCFGTDSVLLSHFALDALPKSADAERKKRRRLIDLGSGTGALSMLIWARTGLSVTAVELDEAQCSRLKRSILLNGLADGEITVVNADYLDEGLLKGEKFDFAVCNPPYFDKNSGSISEKGGATHEISADIDGVSRAAARRLKFGGKLFICFPAARLAEALYALKANGLEPKCLRLVQTRAAARPYLALIRAMRGARPGLIVEKNLIIYKENGAYTQEVAEYYNGE